MGNRVFYDVNRIDTSKVVTSIPILLGHYRQLQIEIFFWNTVKNVNLDKITK